MNYSLAETWVLIGLLMFFGLLIFAGVPVKIWQSLGQTRQQIRNELDEAARIRQEALELLERIRTDKLDAEQKALEMIEQAQIDARLMSEEAHKKLHESIVSLFFIAWFVVI